MSDLLAKAVFGLAMLASAALAGAAVIVYEIPGHRQVGNGLAALGAIYRAAAAPIRYGAFGTVRGRLGETDIPLEAIPDLRIETLKPATGARAAENILIGGGLNEYLDLCPSPGCAGVEFTRSGEVVNAYPYRPYDILAADITDGAYPRYDVSTMGSQTMQLNDVERYANGDLLVIFQMMDETFPFGGGVARIAPDGTPRWYRRDYSHHWATFDPTEPEREIALVPGLRIGERPIRLRYGNRYPLLPCVSGNPQLDTVQFIDGDGTLLREIDLTEVFAESNFAAVLEDTTDGCDPFHLNLIHTIGDDAGPGLTPGDLVLSLRNIGAFAIIDRETGAPKRLVRGTFLQQHAVHHLEGTRFVLLDNRGGDAEFGPTRILEIDVATGAERRIFPTPDTPERFLDLFTNRSGYIDVSDDRQRLLVSMTRNGLALEMDVETGEVLAVVNSLHDVRSVEEARESIKSTAARANLHGADFVSPMSQ